MPTTKTARVTKSVNKLNWMHQNKIWPHSLRYLWTDAFGVVNLASLGKALNEPKYIEEAETLIHDVYHILGRKKGLRIGEAPDRDGQYYHYLTKWMYALHIMGKFNSKYQDMAVELVKQIHPHFLVPNKGICWKMKEDLSGGYHGYGFGALDMYEGYVIYRLIDESALSSEIADLKKLVESHYLDFSCGQDLGLGDMLWTTHFFPEEPWAKHITAICLATLNKMWTKDGFFVRDLSWDPDTVLAFGNFGVSLGLQAQGMWPERVEKLNEFFESFKSHDKYDHDPITHVMQMTSYFPGYFLKNFDQTNL